MTQQFSFDPIDLMDDPGLSRKVAEKECLKSRNSALRDYRNRGFNAVGFTLRDQLRPYKAYGQPDNTVRNVYMLNVSDTPYSTL